MTTHLNKLPCTLAILTKNSGKSLRRALRCAEAFSEVIICDGGSTDDTLDIAREYRARVIRQDERYLYENGRIADFGAIRNQTLESAINPWFFYVDSDEYISDELIDELRAVIVAGDQGVFWIPRRYVLNDVVIECATTYPSYQPRFFHRGAVIGFIKKVHERINPRPGISTRFLRSFMYVPIDDNIAAARAKWSYYISIEQDQRRTTPLWRRLRSAARESAIGVLYLLRLIRVKLFCRGTKLPIRLELMRPWYQVYLVWAILFGYRK